MGKARKRKLVSQHGDSVPGKKLPLDIQLQRDIEESPAPIRRSGANDADDAASDGVVDSKISAKILSSARRQQEELQEEFGVGQSVKSGKPVVGFKLPVSRDVGQIVEEEEEEEEEDDSSSQANDFYEEVDIDEEEEKALEAFMFSDRRENRTLADIFEKLEEKKTEIESQCSESALSATAADKPTKLDPRVVEMYKSVGEILAKYRSGKIPKAFKVIPRLSDWEYVLHLTNPSKWSAAAIFQATRIFSSSLSVKMAQRFYFYVLYPRVRDDISFYKRLNFHLFMALKKALFKPAAFFKGILLPLCESGNCTLREATIVSSILAKCSVPMLHSSAALLKIAEMEYSGANSIFIKTLLDKKYALPFRVIDALVFHFVKFERETRQLPVLWHQALLVFVQRYKEDISSEQKEALYGVVRAQFHPHIGPEIRREMQNSKSRDEEDGEAAAASAAAGDGPPRAISSMEDDEDIEANYRELFG